MLKLSHTCMADVRRYIKLRYNHQDEEWIKARIKDTVRALKQQSREKHEEYSANVAEFFKLNSATIDQAAQDKIDLEEVTAGMQTIMAMDPADQMKLVRKHGGNVNAAVAEASGRNN